MQWTAYSRVGDTIGVVEAGSDAAALIAARKQWVGVSYVEQSPIKEARRVSASKPVRAEVASTSPKVSGKNYYQQDPPNTRGFRTKSFMMRAPDPEDRSTWESTAFDQDAAEHGLSPIGYLRKLWAEDRKRRSLPPWQPQQIDKQ